MRWAIGVAALVTAGCSTVPPPGFAGRQALEPVAVQAKPFVMYGGAPHRWVSPDGEIDVDVDEAWVQTGVAGYQARLRYSVALVDRSAPLRCRFSSDDVGLLACEGTQHDVSFQVGSGCRYPGDLTSPACGHAELRVGSRRLSLHEGHVAGLRAPSGELSILDERGELVAAANVVGEMQIETWLPPLATAPIDRHVALLVFTAHHQWRHRLSVD